MATQSRQRYSAQIRASQYDPDVDISHIRPHPSQDLYPTSSSASKSSTSTILNLSGSNTGPNALQSSSTPQLITINAPPSVSSSSLSLPSGANTTSRPHSSSATTGWAQIYSHLFNRQGSDLPNSSTLLARGSRTSLQRNPSATPSERIPNGVPLMAPIPRQPKMEPAFMKDYQLPEQTTPMTSQDFSFGRSFSRTSTMSTAMNRQDEGRLKLEQEREYLMARRWKTWTKSKVLLLLMNTILMGLSITYTAFMAMSWRGEEWTKQYLDSGIMMVADRKLLYLMTVTPPFGIFVAIVGYIGIFTQSRKVLSAYTVLLWPLFSLMTTIGYISFRRNHVSLYQKLKYSWVYEYSRNDRLVIQNTFSCCGFRSVIDYPSYDLHCFPRAPRPPCERHFLHYQQEFLLNTSTVAFLLIPIQLTIMIVALLCSNHIDNLFRSANPITPKIFTQ